MYPAELIKPMRDDLASAGFEELFTAESVEKAINKALIAHKLIKVEAVYDSSDEEEEQRSGSGTGRSFSSAVQISWSRLCLVNE